MADSGLVKHVVLDAGAFLRNAAVHTIGEKIYTIGDVVNEIRDKATKQRLQVLPYELVFREPAPEAIKAVTDFAKQTGDYRSLSAVDIRVMALTYQLEKEIVGTDHIKTSPDKKAQWTASKRPLEKATEIAGFYLNSNKSTSRTTSESSSVKTSETESPIPDPIVNRLLSGGTDNSKTSDNMHTPSTDTENTTNKSAENTAESQVEHMECVVEITGNVEQANRTEPLPDSEGDKDTDESCPCDKVQDQFEGEVVPDDCLMEGSSDEDSGEDDDDDDAGWITPSNIKVMKSKMGVTETERASVPVGCLTTDFAMQNVLIQMGLNVVSVDGMLIKKARSYVLRCFACMKICTNLQKVFCPHCGNKTLSKVSMTVQEDGSIRYFLSLRRPINTRGTKFTLPMPKGGKHAVNPILVEDQPQPQQRTAKKAQGLMDVFDPDYVVNQSPFLINDVTSKAAQLGIKGRKGQKNNWDRRNPNEVKKNYGRRK